MTPEEFKAMKEKEPRGRKSIYPFNKMSVGDVVRVNTKEMGKTHFQIVRAVHSYSATPRALREHMRFETTRDGDDVLVHRAE